MDQALAQPAARGSELPAEPNLCELRSHNGVSINYSASSITGEPTFQYKDRQREISRRGKEIRRIETEIGTLVTVTLQLTVDAGSTDVTVLLPRTRLPDSHEARISTVAIVTANRTPSRPNPSGQLQKYSVLKLNGTARLVFF